MKRERGIFLAIGLWLPALAHSQAAGSEAPLTFEVASIKLNTSMSTNRSVNRAPGGALDATNVSLRALITLAYDVLDYQVLNAPGWAEAEGYDILAKPAATEKPDNSPGQLRRRVQALLADRFGLALHTESREMSIFALVVAKGGPKLELSKTAIGPQVSYNYTRLTCKKVTMQRLAEVLAGRMGRSVMDKTGLTGEYDFQMEFVPDEGPPKDGDAAASNAPAGPSFLAALQEQLGLRLETTKGPVQFLVIDRVQKPTEN